MNGILTAVYSIIIFSLIIFVHEFGHFITAKAFGVLVHEFAIGMGPAIFKKQKGETLYSVRAIPIGGYCAMEGENGESEDPRSFGKKSKFKRFIILAAGAVMNLILGFAVISLFFGVNNQEYFVSTVIESVDEGSPAYEAGLLPGDKVIRVNGHSLTVKSEVEIYGSFDKAYNLTVKRGKEKLNFSIVPRETETVIDGKTYKRRIMGIRFATVEKNFATMLEYSFKNTVFMGKLVFISLGQLLSGAASPSSLSGPVGIINEINTAASSGLADILYLMALITINIGLFNLLPIPALDGGRILFIIIEAIIRKPIPAKYEGLCHGIGFALLIGLMLFATGNDIMRLIK